MTFSVLICTYNRPGLLAGALAALIDGTREKPDEVVVVNGGGPDADRVVESFMDRPGVRVRLVKVVNKNLAANRNAGLPHCTGEVVGMTDDDGEVFPDWVALMKLVHRAHPEAGAVGGKVVGADSDSLVSRASDHVTFPEWPEARFVRTLPGVNISYKRDILLRLGPQDETLSRGEDVDFNWRLHRLGSKVYFTPDIKVIHHHRATLGGLLWQHYRYGRSYYWVRLKWPDLYCIYPHDFRTAKSFLKLANFLAALAYEPCRTAWRLPRWSDRILLAPVFFLTGLAWRAGMLVELARRLGGKGPG